MDYPTLYRALQANGASMVRSRAMIASLWPADERQGFIDAAMAHHPEANVKSVATDYAQGRQIALHYADLQKPIADRGAGTAGRVKPPAEIAAWIHDKAKAYDPRKATKRVRRWDIVADMPISDITALVKQRGWRNYTQAIKALELLLDTGWTPSDDAKD